MKSNSIKPSRRRFLGHASCAGITAVPVLNTLLNLNLSSSVANAVTLPDPNEYRAIVCLFQAGGNDSFNMLAPFSGPSSTAEDAYAEYAAARSDLALPKASEGDNEALIEIRPENTPGRTFGLHPGMPHLASLFESGNAAFVTNVGTLIEPVTHFSQVHENTIRLPLGLYSHSDQIEQWQTSVPHSRSGIGWAGRMMDLIKDINPDPVVSMNISANGANVWQTGVTGAEYSVSSGSAMDPEGGAIPLEGYEFDYAVHSWGPPDVIANATGAAIDNQLALHYQDLLSRTFQAKRRDTLAAYEKFSVATADPLPGDATFPNTPVGRQLRQVAKALAGREALEARRQTFFVQRGGWDHHSETLPLQAAMLPEIDDALAAFWEQLGILNLQDQVVIFSASDFGRTLTSNGRGSDHAWGGNQFVIGGSVHGKNLYGDYPSLALNTGGLEPNALDTGRGRLIPTTSCDAFFAELALWLGVPASDLPLVLPNIGHFFTPTDGASPVGYLA